MNDPALSPMFRSRFGLLVAFGLTVAPMACGTRVPVAADGCPKDLLGAQGSSCEPDGKTCGLTSGQTTHFLMCSRGKWTEFNAPPMPPPPASAR